MRIARKAIGTTAAALAMATTLAACSGGGGDAAPTGSAQTLDPQEEVTLTFTFWGNDDRAAKYAESIALFEEANPNIDVQESFQAFPDYWTARNTEAAGRSLPDVLQMDLSYLRQFAANGLLSDMGEQVDVNLDVSGFDETLLASGQIDGEQVGIPTSTNTLGLFYNPGLLETMGVEAPTEEMTWEEYADWIVEASEAGGDQDPPLYGGVDFTGTFWFFVQQVMQQGKQPFTEDGELGFTEEDMKAWLEIGQPLRDAQAVFPVEQAVQLAPKGGFTVNESATEVSWDNFLAGYVADSGTEDIAMAPIPVGEEGAKQFYKPSMLLSPSANSEHPEAAAAFIDFMVNEPEVGRIFGTSKGVPAVAAQREAMDVEPGSVDERVVAYEEAVAERVTEPSPIPVEGFGAVEAEYLRLSEELAYGNVTIDEFVEQWFAFAESNIAQG